MLFDESQDSRGDLVLRDGDDIVYVFLDDIICILTRVLDGDTVGKGRNSVQGGQGAVLEALIHTRGKLGLHTVDLHVGVEMLDGIGHAREQSAAADGDDDGLYVGELVEDLQTDGALPRDDLVIVEGMDEGSPRLLDETASFFISIIVGSGNEANLCPECLGGLYLADGCAVGHTDGGFNAHAGGGQGNTLGVVACATGDDTRLFLLVSKLADLIVSTTELEATRDLKVFGLQIQGVVGGQLLRQDEVGLAGNGLEDEGGLLDIIQRKCVHDGFL